MALSLGGHLKQDPPKPVYLMAMASQGTAKQASPHASVTPRKAPYTTLRNAASTKLRTAASTNARTRLMLVAALTFLRRAFEFCG